MKRIILFGAGKKGIEALEYYGKKRVAFFCDNSKEKTGRYIDGVEVISFDRMLELYSKDLEIVITPNERGYLRAQLELNGVKDYSEYYDKEFWNIDQRYKTEMGMLKKHNDQLQSFVDECQKLDLFFQFHEFKELTDRLFHNGTLCKEGLAFIGKNTESNFYGNLDALLCFADIDKTEANYFPIVSHQDVTYRKLPVYMYDCAVIFSGERYKTLIHERCRWIPVFTVGPYIYYAEGIYNRNQRDLLKKRWGKILTVFLPHSIETTQRNYNEEKYIDLVLEKYSGQFNTILLCVYWADAAQPVCSYAEEKGMHIVSAGYRFDPMFDRRQKTMFELTDAIVCGDPGSYVNYALFYNKPVGVIRAGCDLEADISMELEGVARSIEYGSDNGSYSKRFYELFSDRLEITEEQKAFINELAGFDQIKDRTFFENVLSVNKMIWNICNWDLSNYQFAVQQTYQNLEKAGNTELFNTLKSGLRKE